MRHLSQTRGMVGVALIVSILLLFSATPAFASPHANTGRITGQLLNGTKNNVPVAGETVTLQVAEGQNARDVTSVKTDARGFYSFPKLATGADISYAVFTRYQGAQYVSDLVSLNKKPDQKINLTIYEATSDSSKLAIELVTVLVREPESKSQTFSVSTLYLFRNLDIRTFVGSLDATKGRPKALFFSLPQGARSINLDKGFNGYRAIQAGTGFASDAAIAPGKVELAFSYEIPYSAASYDFRYTAMYPTVSLSVLVPPSLRGSSNALTAQGLTTVNQREYRQLNGKLLTTNEEVHVQLEGFVLPAATGTASFIDPKVLWLIVGIIILLAIVALLSFINRLPENIKEGFGKRGKRKGGRGGRDRDRDDDERRESRAKAKRDEDEHDKDRKQELLKDLRELDKAYEARKISKTVYQERRARLKARLRSLMSEEEERARR